MVPCEWLRNWRPESHDGDGFGFCDGQHAAHCEVHSRGIAADGEDFEAREGMT